MKDLRKVMFERKEEGEAFHELSDEELALLEDQIEVYIEEGRLRVVDTDVEDLVRSYRVIRHDLLTGREEITPEQFREASNQITETIFKDIYNDDNLDPDKTVVLMPWRAGLAFGEAATKNKLNNFYHLGAKRNEETLETEIYYEKASEVLDKENSDKNGDIKVIIADPMLATGNTMIDSIERLKKLGIKEENIIIASVISAPEGIDHILSNYPDLKISVGSHDEKLNNAGYIVPGLGDFGDMHFADLRRSDIEAWRKTGILDEETEKALLQRIDIKEAN